MKISMKMSRKRWAIGSALVALFALGALTVGVVAAQSDDDSGRDSFAARVAQILNLDEDTVRDAMDQAKRELREERVQEKLDELVASGEITQEQADEYITWLQSAPEGVYSMKGRGFKKSHHGRRGGHHW